MLVKHICLLVLTGLGAITAEKATKKLLDTKRENEELKRQIRELKEELEDEREWRS